jgi:hypothetical protein
MTSPKTEFKLGMAVPGASDAQSLMRGYGPLSQMAKADRRLKLVPAPRNGEGANEYDWAWLIQLDALLIQRPFSAVHAQVVVLAQMLGLPVWIDWDDDLTQVRRTNPNYHYYADPELKGRLKFMTEAARVVSVSTPALAQRVGPKARLVRNAQMWPVSSAAPERVVVWRGGGGQRENILSVLDAIERVARLPQLANWSWHFLGEVPAEVGERLAFLEASERIVTGFWADPFTYMRTLHALAPYVVLVPMEDTAFNRARSASPVLEATSAGAVALARNLPEYAEAGALTYDTGEDFERLLRTTLEGYDERRHGRVEEARAMQQHYDLESINEHRWTILRELGFPEDLILERRPVAAAGVGAAGG